MNTKWTEKSPLPTFLVIGAARSGTTSLHHYLNSHPEIYMSRVKEPNFFAHDGERFEFHSFAPDWEILARLSVTDPHRYRKLFRGVSGEKAVGEVSPSYMRSPGAAERIHRTIPDVLLIAILRHPADRAYANFLGRLRDGTEPSTDPYEAIGDALHGRGPSWRSDIYIEAGCYHARLRPFFQRFDRKRIRIHLFEEFIRDPGAVLSDLFSFLDVDPMFVPDIGTVHNPTGRIDNPLLRFAWTKSRAVRTRLGPWTPASIRGAAWRVLQRNLTRPPLPRDLRAALVEHYRPDILELERLLDRDLSIWLQ